MSYNDSPSVGPKQAFAWVGVVLGSLALVILLIVGMIAGFSTFGRYQRLANVRNEVKAAQLKAHNQVLLTNIAIGTTQQKVKIAQQEAAIRLQQAIGVREAQDEISKTLTPLYVQFEMIDALKQIALSGRNSSVIYIPTGPNGLPVVSPVRAQP